MDTKVHILKRTRPVKEDIKKASCFFQDAFSRLTRY